MSTQALALSAIVIASIFWSTTGLAGKILLRQFDPYTLAFLRTGLASLFLIPLFIKMNTHRFVHIFRDILPVALAFTINFFLFYVGLSKTTANASAIIYAVTPIIVVLLSHFFLKERTTRQKILGIIIGLTGSILILVLPLFEKGQTVSGNLTGNMYMALAMLSWALYTVGSRRLSKQKQYSPIIIMSVSTFVCAITFLFIVIYTHHQANILLLFTSWNNFMWLIYLAIFVTIVTNYLHQWAIKHSSTTMATLTHYLQPVFAFGFNSILLGETLNPGMIMGCLIIMVGVFLASGTKMRLLWSIFKTK